MIENQPIRLKIANILRNFHRHSAHPEADPTDVSVAIDAVLRAVCSDEDIALLAWMKAHRQSYIREFERDVKRKAVLAAKQEEKS